MGEKARRAQHQPAAGPGCRNFSLSWGWQSCWAQKRPGGELYHPARGCCRFPPDFRGPILILFGLSKSRCRLTQGQEGSAQVSKTPGRLYCEGKKGKNLPRTHQEQVGRELASTPVQCQAPQGISCPQHCWPPNKLRQTQLVFQILPVPHLLLNPRETETFPLPR